MKSNETAKEFMSRPADNLVEALVQAALKSIPKSLIDAISVTLAKNGYVIGDNAIVEYDTRGEATLVLDHTDAEKRRGVLVWKPMVVVQHSDGSLGFHWGIIRKEDRDKVGKPPQVPPVDPKKGMKFDA